MVKNAKHINHAISSRKATDSVVNGILAGRYLVDVPAGVFDDTR